MPTPLPLDAAPIHVSDAVLDDLRDRLRRTRWAEDAGNDDGLYGVPRAQLEDLCAYWADGYDWRAAERQINRYEHYRTEIDGTPIHLMRCPAATADATPLILTHGWPWTFWHWSKVVDALADPAAHGGDPADAFDVLVPSFPGFGFSSPLTHRPDMNFWKVAGLWHTLMTERLGYTRYGAGGCDVGALVTSQLGHEHAEHVEAIHIGSGMPLTLFNGERAWNVSGGAAIPDGLAQDARERLLELERRFAVHLAAHVLAPSTLAHALTDSPAGMLAWVLERWTSWSDTGGTGDVERVFTRDELLTHATIFWATSTIGTSMRTYANNARFPWTPSHDRTPAVEAPTGITFVGHENPPGVTTDTRVETFVASGRADQFHHVHLTAHDRGGHFIPWEIPDLWVEDLRRTFRLARGRQRDSP